MSFTPIVLSIPLHRTCFAMEYRFSGAIPLGELRNFMVRQIARGRRGTMKKS